MCTTRSTSSFTQSSCRRWGQALRLRNPARLSSPCRMVLARRIDCCLFPGSLKTSLALSLRSRVEAEILAPSTRAWDPLATQARDLGSRSLYSAWKGQMRSVEGFGSKFTWTESRGLPRPSWLRAMSTSADTGQKGGPSPDDEYQGQISSIQQIFAEYDHNGSGKVRVERVPDLIVNLGRDLQVGREVARQLSGSGAVELTTFEEVVQTLKRVEESQDREPDSETTTPLTLLKRLNAYRKQCESNGECARASHVKSAKLTLRSSRGFGTRRSPTADLSRLQPLPPPVQVEAGEQPSGVVASKDDAVEHAGHDQELCSICLEGLDDCSFSYPCGQGHRLHYHCMLHFLGSILALPLSDETPGPLRKEQVREMGTGFKAVALLEAAMQNLHAETRRRLCCPLCRCSWPDEAEVSLEHTMASLRQCRIKKLAKNIGSLEKAFNSVKANYDQRAEIGRHRMGHGLTVLDNNLHTAASYLSHRDTACSTVLRIFEFLDARHVTSVSACCTAAARHCWVECKLRAPHVKAATATHHIWPQTTRSLLIDPSLRTAVQKGTSGLDVVSFSKWLACAAGLLEVNIHAAGWEKLDPGAGYLSQSLPIQHLQILDLSHNGLTDLGAQNLAAALTKKRPVRLEVLTLELNCITEAGFDSLLSLGKDIGNRIRSWGFRHNKLGDASCKLLAKALDPEGIGAPNRLNVWDLRTNRIGLEGCKALVPVIGSMEVARLGCNPLGDAGGEQLANGLGRNLRILDLRQAELGEAGDAHRAAQEPMPTQWHFSIALETVMPNFGAELCGRIVPDLQELLLSGNNIGPAGAQALAEGWAWISSLRHVDLSGNMGIGREGVDLLADELPFWQQAPFRLSLASIGCEDEGAKRLAAALRKNPRKGRGWTIELQNNPIGSWMKLQILQLLEEDLFRGYLGPLCEAETGNPAIINGLMRAPWVFRRPDAVHAWKYRYVEAQKARKKYEELRTKEEERQRRLVDQAQQHEMMEVEQAQRAQFLGFSNAWDKYMADYESTAYMSLERLKEQHGEELGRFQDMIRNQPPRVKCSRELLELRRKQEALAKLGKYEDAWKVKEDGDQLEQWEQARSASLVSDSAKRQETRLRSQQQKADQANCF
eukprot:s121_g32.t2